MRLRERRVRGPDQTRDVTVFYGTYNHSIDEKGRTSLPVKFREVLSARSEELLIATPGWPDKCLWFQPRSVWEEMIRKIDARPEVQQEGRRIFVGQAHDVAVDRLGRILAPPPLRAYAGLSDQVVWIGVSSRIELWNAATWNEMQSGLQANEGLARTFRGMGL